MQTHNPGIEYEYTVPKENVTNNRKPEFSWDYTDWSHCTVSCGGGNFSEIFSACHIKE